MCGICGSWKLANSVAVENMVDAMDHRGPDDRGVYRDDVATLGMSRLAILDRSRAGHQPMANPERSVWIVFNGEVYNFKDERAILRSKGHTFVSNTDTEVVLRMYEQYGDDFALRLRGMFAVAIFDKRAGPGCERLLVVRDQLGIKPLLYAEINGGLVFASEIKAIVASGVISRDIDPVALRRLLTYGSVYQPNTMLRGVKMLLPAHRLIAERGRVRVERYWSLAVNRRDDIGALSYSEQVEALSEALQQCVRAQLVSDVPIGAFLSGGVDSSVLVAMVAQALGTTVKTFSVGFGSEGRGIDESDEARRTAAFLGTDHNHVLVRGADVRERISHIAASLDQPSVDGVNSYFVSWAARQAVTVAISGTGGDEIFAGYPWFINMVLARERLSRTPGRELVKSLAANIARHSIFDRVVFRRGGKRVRRLRDGAGFISQFASNYQIFGAVGAARAIAPELREEARVGRATYYDLEPIDELADGSTVARVSGLCLRGYTVNQLLRDIDAVSMAHSLEVRVPYLDTAIVDLALSLPDATKLGNLKGLAAPEQSSYRDTGAKRILVDVGKPLLPRDFDAQPKRGFSMPFSNWLQGPLREVLTDALSEDRVRRRGWLDPLAAKSVLENFLRDPADWTRPWLLMMVELWGREILDGHRTGATYPLRDTA